MTTENKDKITSNAILIEAKSIITDLVATQGGIALLMAGKEGCEKAISYAAGVIHAELSAGHLDLILNGNPKTGLLFGYSLVVPPHAGYPAFIQKLWVDERARNSGLGTEMLKKLKFKYDNDLAALVVSGAVKFFRKNGFKELGEFSGLQTTDPDFTLSNGLYAGTNMMATKASTTIGSSLILNNNDVTTIIKLALGTE